MFRLRAVRLWSLVLVPAMTAAIGVTTASGGERHARKARRTVIAERARPVYPTDSTYSSQLGTFNPSPAIMVQGNYPVGGGYAPLGIFGDQNMSLYGPFSGLRTTTAPVITYVRGYDGVVRPSEGVTATYPNLPRLAPLAYPTRANHYYAPRILESPADTNASMWIDHN
jgi:hypothetical protein